MVISLFQYDTYNESWIELQTKLPHKNHGFVATFVDSSIFPPCGNNIIHASCFLPSFISQFCNSKESRRKRETEQDEQGVEILHSDKSEKMDMMMNPEKAKQYRKSVERTKQDIRLRQSLLCDFKRVNSSF